MLAYPHFDPIAFSIGPIPVHWYGIMYLIGFTIAWLLINIRAKKTNIGMHSSQIADLIFYAALGVIIGGRLGYMLFYDFIPFIHQPWRAFEVWNGGMSFHGGLLGVTIALGFYSKKVHQPFLTLTDFIAPMVPVGLGLGRLGNFINGELWGRITHVPWAMVFPRAGPLPRHPSQLYEFLLEGVLLFIILWVYSGKPRPRARVSALFLLCYGLFRFGVEFFRQPDPQLGFVAFGWMTRGQELSIPMVVLSCLLFLYSCYYQVK